eukprot:Nk52_evm58s2118 gene=Nk52_evmTU58s2118
MQSVFLLLFLVSMYIDHRPCTMCTIFILVMVTMSCQDTITDSCLLPFTISIPGGDTVGCSSTGGAGSGSNLLRVGRDGELPVEKEANYHFYSVKRSRGKRTDDGNSSDIAASSEEGKNVAFAELKEDGSRATTAAVASNSGKSEETRDADGDGVSKMGEKGRKRKRSKKPKGGRKDKKRSNRSHTWFWETTKQLFGWGSSVTS